MSRPFQINYEKTKNQTTSRYVQCSSQIAVNYLIVYDITIFESPHLRDHVHITQQDV